jgi:hypothetical protein
MNVSMDKNFVLERTFTGKHEYQHSAICALINLDKLKFLNSGMVRGSSSL